MTPVSVGPRHGRPAQAEGGAEQRRAGQPHARHPVRTGVALQGGHEAEEHQAHRDGHDAAEPLQQRLVRDERVGGPDDRAQAEDEHDGEPEDEQRRGPGEPPPAASGGGSGGGRRGGGGASDDGAALGVLRGDLLDGDRGSGGPDQPGEVGEVARHEGDDARGREADEARDEGEPEGEQHGTRGHRLGQVHADPRGRAFISRPRVGRSRPRRVRAGDFVLPDVVGHAGSLRSERGVPPLDRADGGRRSPEAAARPSFG